MRTQAESAVRSQYRMKWSAGEPVGAMDAGGGAAGRSLQAVLPALPDVKKGEAGDRRPFLYYFYSQRTKEPASASKRAPAQLSPQAELSRKVGAEAFNGGDIRIGLMAPLFRSLQVDVSNVTPTDNPVLNCNTAPMVAVLDPAGKVVRVIQGAQINERSVYDAMVAGLASVDRNATITVQKLVEIARKREALELDILQARPAAAGSSRTSTVRRMGTTTAGGVDKKATLEAQRKDLDAQADAVINGFLKVTRN